MYTYLGVVGYSLESSLLYLGSLKSLERDEGDLSREGGALLRPHSTSCRRQIRTTSQVDLECLTLMVPRGPLFSLRQWSFSL